MRLIRPLAAAAAISVLATPAFSAAHLDYPETHKGKVVDDYNGQMVPDPYRWLEKDARSSPEVRRWVGAENKLTLAYLKNIPQRQAILERLKKLWDFEKYTAPFKIAGRFYYFKNSGLQNQSVLYGMESLKSRPVTILDPNQWSTDGTVALVGLSFSEDGNFLAYARASAGSDWQEWRLHDLRNGKDLDDLLKWTKFTSASWTSDSKGFFYSRFDAPPKDQEYKALNKNQKVFYHRIGTPQADDVLVFQRPDQPDWGFAPSVTEDGRYLVISIWKGTAPKNQLLYKDLLEPYGMPVSLVDRFENEYTVLGNDGPIFYIKTDLDAPRGRVISIDIRHPEPSRWRELIPQAKQALQDVELTGNLFIASYLQDAVSRVRIFRLDGTHLRDVDLPGLGTASGFAGRRSDTETFFSYTSFNRPSTIYHYDLISGGSSLWRQPKIAFRPEDFSVEQVFYKSKDGTRVPMFIAHKKGLTLDGHRPTLLYGYGGFSISLTPGFSAARLAWMEMGGVFAMPNLRGGGEYGEEWHRAGTLARKQNVFDDFIAAAKWLMDNHYTQTTRLAIQGASNGGLLVGATMTQRPDLFGAALPAVGVMDMLRFQKFTAGRYWVDDYGSSDIPEQFAWLRAYSPYHNIHEGTHYPATLVTTADTDDRVIPGHSFKFASALQAAQAGNAPILIRIETSAGHGGGKPTQKRIEEAADQWAFLFKNLHMDLPGD